MRWTDLENEACPVARGLSVIGERWTLLILRDCFLGVRRFDDFQASLGITRHLLADRLKTLEAKGLLRREQYQERPPRFEYRLTETGKDLFPVLVSLITWANCALPSPEGSPYRLVSRQTGQRVTPVLCDDETGARLNPRNLRLLMPGEDAPGDEPPRR
ncbi:winged helix-turn-helix transcriptional regulator [Antarcticimicrobium luteum]|uniref:Transcriptional regulator n=1 Tax=Antarcticimicrobium luteum TaxID=2547397 RepID=A0A4R5UVR4_9RHOB|nr:helix-turn-helix domain-containing protein [Antarcticimicrobium luteum]TDK43175.1 transcriptional regulator [Antarcticimicrobium luteum]